MAVAALVLSLVQLGTSPEWKRLQCEGTAVVDRYVNYAEGFSVGLPRGLPGRRGQQGGPERGISIPLSRDCNGVVVIYGEPNSADWPTAKDAMSATVDLARSRDPAITIVRYATRLGSLRAAGATIRFSRTREVEDWVVAFRPGGGPVYTALLVTTADRHARDRRSFEKILSRFRLEKWR